MIQDNLFPAMTYEVPPLTMEKADERVQEFASTSLYGLIGMKFLGVNQIRHGLSEIGFNLLKTKELKDCSCGLLKTAVYLAVGKDETAYNLLITEGETFATVTNAKLTHAGTSIDKDDLKAFKDMTSGEPEEDNNTLIKLPPGPAGDIPFSLVLPKKDTRCVHKQHCCSTHGCKYGDTNCPITTGKKKQDHPCEDCPRPKTAWADIVAVDIPSSDGDTHGHEAALRDGEE